MNLASWLFRCCLFCFEVKIINTQLAVLPTVMGQTSNSKDKSFYLVCTKIYVWSQEGKGGLSFL